MKFRRLKIIADPQHPELLSVVDVESGDLIYGIVAVNWEAAIVEEFPIVTLRFMAGMIDFEVVKRQAEHSIQH